MKIKEYAANVSEYTEVVDAPYNHTGGEEVLDERPMGFVKGGLQKLGAKVLPGSYGKQMKGQVQSGQKANQLYSDFHEFLGQTGYKSTDTALKAFLQQQGINVDVDSIVNSVAPAPAAPSPAPAPASGSPAPAAGKGFNVKLPQKTPTPAPVAESIDSLNRILVLSGRAPKKIINENKNTINEEVALNRRTLDQIFIQVAQQAARPSSGGSASTSPASGSPAPTAGGGSSSPASASSAPAAPAASSGGVVSKVAGAVKGAINKLTTPTAAPASAPPVEPPAPVSAPAAGSSAPPVEPPAPVSAPAAPKASAPASKGSAPTSTAPGPLGGTKPGAAAAKAAGSQKQSTQSMNDYVKNVSSQINAAQTKPEKIELAKELINFMSDRKGSPEYDNAMGSAKAVLKKAGLNNMLTPLGGGQTTNQKPQGLRNPPAAPKAAPPAAPTAAPKAAPTAAPTTPAPETPAPRAGFKVGAKELNKTRDMNTMFKAARGLAEDRVLHRNSYIFIKKVLENTDLTLRDLGYRVSISESTSDSVTLIPR